MIWDFVLRWVQRRRSINLKPLGDLSILQSGASQTCRMACRVGPMCNGRKAIDTRITDVQSRFPHRGQYLIGMASYPIDQNRQL
jgi:hypothetical protein